ncbi:MAG: cation transporter [Alphaproteobacteria bacterium]|nr:cation transporter [Alphaproteobacteria bacterium]
MGHDHAQASSGPGGTTSGRYSYRLGIALGLTLTYMSAEVIGGILTGSLALLADAAHMLTDAAGLGLALLAIHFAAKPATAQKTYGYMRAEILSALANSTFLLLITGYILYEAYTRFVSPPEIASTPMMIVAVIGLIVNLISMRILSSGSSESLNVRGAYFEVLSDMLGSIGVIVAALVIKFTGWTVADPIIAAAIGLFIIPRTWRLLNETVHILLEGVPKDIDLAEVAKSLSSIEDVGAIHDLHVWTITSGMNAMSVHIRVAMSAQSPVVLQRAREIMRARYNIEHVTIQIETDDQCSNEVHLPV